MTNHFDSLPASERITTVEKALVANGFLPFMAATKAEALSKIKELIPAGASVMTGASRTLEEIGFTDYLKEGAHGWNNLRGAILAETDPAKQADLRRRSVVSDFYVGSVHAISETGELVIASASGSQLPHLAFTSPNLILVVSTKKLVATLSEAHQRVAEHVFPLEDARMKSVGFSGSLLAKELVLHKEHPMMGRKVHVILVNEKLGF